MNDIVNLLAKYQDYIRDLKNQGHVILGYCRKSRTAKNNATVIESLKSMVTELQRRSLVDLIKDLAKMDKARLAIIDSAGLTTNMDDLELFIRYVTCNFLSKTIANFGFSEHSNFKKNRNRYYHVRQSSIHIGM